jgi:hypothetical protein
MSVLLGPQKFDTLVMTPMVFERRVTNVRAATLRR